MAGENYKIIKKDPKKAKSNAFMITNDLRNGIISNSIDGAKPVETYEDFKTYLLKLSEAFLNQETEKSTMITLDDGTSYPLVGFKGYTDEKGRKHQFASNQELYNTFNNIYTCMRRVLKTIKVPRDNAEEYRKDYKNAFNKESNYYPGTTSLSVDYPKDVSKYVYNNFYNMKNIIKLLDKYSDKELANDIIKKTYNEFKDVQEIRVGKFYREEDDVLENVDNYKKRINKENEYKKNNPKISIDDQLKAYNLSTKDENGNELSEIDKFYLLEKQKNQVFIDTPKEEREKELSDKWRKKRKMLLDRTLYETIDSNSRKFDELEKEAKGKNISIGQLQNEKLYKIDEDALNDFHEFVQDPFNNLELSKEDISDMYNSYIDNHAEDIAKEFGYKKDDFIYNYVTTKLKYDYYDISDELKEKQLKDNEINKDLGLARNKLEIYKNVYKNITEKYKNDPRIELLNYLDNDEIKVQYNKVDKEKKDKKTAILNDYNSEKERIKNTKNKLYKFEPTDKSFQHCYTSQTGYRGLYEFIGSRFNSAQRNTDNKLSPNERAARMLDTYHFLLNRHKERSAFSMLWNAKKYYREYKKLEEMKKELLNNEELKSYINKKNIDNLKEVSKALGKFQAKLDYEKGLREIDKEYPFIDLKSYEKYYYFEKVNDNLLEYGLLDERDYYANLEVKKEENKIDDFFNELKKIADKELKVDIDKTIEEKRNKLQSQISESERRNMGFVEVIRDKNKALGKTNLEVVDENDDELEEDSLENEEDEITFNEHEFIEVAKVDDIGDIDLNIDVENIENTDYLNVSLDENFIEPDLDDESISINLDDDDELEDEQLEDEEEINPLNNEKKFDQNASVMDITMNQKDTEDILGTRKARQLNDTVVVDFQAPKKKKKNEKTEAEKQEEKNEVKEEKKTSTKKSSKKNNKVVENKTIIDFTIDSKINASDNEITINDAINMEKVEFENEFNDLENNIDNNLNKNNETLILDIDDINVNDIDYGDEFEDKNEEINYEKIDNNNQEYIDKNNLESKSELKESTK